MKKIICATVLMVLFIGCSNKFLDETPPHFLSADNLYTSYDGFKAGIYGLYSLARDERSGSVNENNEIKNQVWLAGNDIMVYNSPDGFSRLINIWGTNNQPTNARWNDIWSWLYEIVNSANTIIIRAEEAEIDWTESQKNDIIAHAKFFRAWAYRHLTESWGNVPLNLEEASSDKIKDWTRASKAEVQAQMEKDWQFAESNLPVDYTDDGSITSWVAKHYLAELYIIQKKYALAIQKADEVINSGKFSLIAKRYGVKANNPGVPFMDMFYDGNSNRSQGNTEALWVFQYEYQLQGGGWNIMRRIYGQSYDGIKVGGKSPFVITAEYGGRSIMRHSPTKFMFDLYEKGDDRGSEFAWTFYYIINNPKGIPAGKKLGDTIWFKVDNKVLIGGTNNREWPTTRKWLDGTPESDPLSGGQFNDQIYLRLAETYLLKAEAQLLNKDAAGAAVTLNVIRARSNASPITTSDVDIDFILDERARELYCEEHRRYVLLRNKKWYERFILHNTTPASVLLITERDTILPIPQSVIDANLITPMEQNPGY